MTTDDLIDALTRDVSDVDSEDTIRAGIVAMLYSEYSRSGMDETDAILPKTDLAHMAAPGNHDHARRIIHEMAADDDVPVALSMDRTAVEFQIQDNERLTEWANNYVEAHDPRLIPL